MLDTWPSSSPSKQKGLTRLFLGSETSTLLYGLDLSVPVPQLSLCKAGRIAFLLSSLPSTTKLYMRPSPRCVHTALHPPLQSQQRAAQSPQRVCVSEHMYNSFSWCCWRDCGPFKAQEGPWVTPSGNLTSVLNIRQVTRDAGFPPTKPDL